jgi:peptidoglycan/xylan/chitin deacetylase (PgdA/CDA1 family)
LSQEACERDLRESRELLSDLLGRPVTLLAYPRSRHNAAVHQAAERAGYTSAFTLPERRERPGPYAIPRVGVHRGNGSWVLRVKATRPYLPLRTSARTARAAHRATRAVRALQGSGR